MLSKLGPDSNSFISIHGYNYIFNYMGIWAKNLQSYLVSYFRDSLQAGPLGTTGPDRSKKDHYLEG